MTTAYDPHADWRREDRQEAARKSFTIDLTLSSHPEFTYFASTKIQGRQLSSRFRDRDEMNTWVAKVLDAGLANGWNANVSDQTR